MKIYYEKHKKFLSLIIAIIMLCIPTTVAFAQDYKEVDIDTQLLNRGYPQALINELVEKQKLDLIEQDCYYESSSTSFYDENGCLIYETTPEDIGIMPYGQIQAAHLSLTIAASKSGTNTVVTVKYNWLTLPLNRYQDPICVGWDKGIFYLKDTGFRKVDTYQAIFADSGIVYTDNRSNETVCADCGQNYITWYADLVGYAQTVISLYGYGTFTLVPKKTGQTTSITAHYVHAKTPFSISASYSGVGFTVSGVSTYDEMSKNLNVKS